MNIDALKRLWKSAFGDEDSFIDMFFETGFSPQRCRSIWEDGKAVAALYWFDGSWQGKRIAYIYALATDPAFRGRGYASRLLQETNLHLRSLGYAGTVLKPDGALFSFYARLGYETCCYVNLLEAQADTPVPLERISGEEYGVLRRNYLPAGALMQDEAVLDFLGQWMAFYKGRDFLLCAGVEAGKLYVQELLGNGSAAPGILGALGISRGIFRTPGREIPFAMYRSLDDSEGAPAYLGLALD